MQGVAQDARERQKAPRASQNRPKLFYFPGLHFFLFKRHLVHKKGQVALFQGEKGQIFWVFGLRIPFSKKCAHKKGQGDQYIG